MPVLREHRVRRVLEPIVIAGAPAQNVSRADLRYVLDIGLLRGAEGALAIANPIHEQLVPSHWRG